MAYQTNQYLPFASMQYDPSLYASVYGAPNQFAQQPVNAVVSVTGIEGAKAYKLPPNSSIPLFDRDEDVFYLKTTDDAGFATIRVFKYQEEIQEPEPDPEKPVSRSEFESLLSRVDRLLVSLGEQEGNDGQ